MTFSSCVCCRTLKGEIQEQVDAFKVISDSSSTKLNTNILIQNIRQLVAKYENKENVHSSHLPSPGPIKIKPPDQVTSPQDDPPQVNSHDNDDVERTVEAPKRRRRKIKKRLTIKKSRVTKPIKTSKKRRIRTIGGDGRKVCPICSKSYANTGALHQHKLIHLKEAGRRFKCEACQKSFVQRTHLQQHIRSSHTGERPYPCTLCSMSFIQLSHLNQHIRWHKGDCPYQCPFCPSKFVQKSSLDSHVTRHSKIKKC